MSDLKYQAHYLNLGIVNIMSTIVYLEKSLTENKILYLACQIHYS